MRLTLRRAVLPGLAVALSVFGSAHPASQQPPPAPAPAQPQEQPAPPPPEQPVFRVGINFVRVDVIVTDKQGNPVADLKQQDFEILEDGKPQSIQSFRLIRNTGQAEAGAEPARPIRSDFDEEREAARDDVRLFAIFLDDYHVRRGAAMFMREQLARFIQNRLGPLDMVALMYPLTPIDVVRLSRDRDSIVGAILRFEGRKYEYTPRNSFEEQYAMYPASTVERIRNQVSLSALKSLVTHLGALREGRKSVIIVSEGYTNTLPPQLRDPVAGMPIGNPNRGNPMAGEGSQMEDTGRFFNMADMQTDLREVYNTANRNNTALYTLDPRGLAGFEFDINEGVGMTTDRASLGETMDTLRLLADQTDGRAIVSRNDLETGLLQVVKDSSAYYLIGYNSTQAPTDGKFHEIKVRVKKPGTQVRARKGYWALTAEESARALAPPKPAPPPAVTAALSTVVDTPRSRVVRTWIGTQKSENGRTRVTFVWDPLPGVPGVAREIPARVSLTAVGSNGNPYFRGRVPEETAETAETAETVKNAPASATTGAPAAAARKTSQVSFEAPPGRLQMKVSVEGARGQLLDSSVQEIIVPDFTAPQLLVTSPAVIPIRSGLEFKNYSTNPDAPATALRDFRRTDRLLLRFGAYAPGNAPISPTARLLNKSAQPMAELTVKPPTAGVPYQVDLPLSSLATGEYLVELKVVAEGAEAKELLAFRVIS